MANNFALPHINNLKPYKAGKPIETLAREKNLTKIIKLASNENPFGPSNKVINAINNHLNSIHLYPDPDQYDLKNHLSKLYNIQPEMLAIGNGSDELLQMIMRAFVSSSDSIIYPKYSFISYKVCADAIGAKSKIAEINNNWENNLDNVLQEIDSDTKLICFANPNNPTGTYLDINIIESFLNEVPKTILVVLDEAYFEFIKYSSPLLDFNQYQDPSIQLVNKFKNLIITRTFSKAYGLAGLRSGYCITHPDIANIINKIKQPFNLNRVAQFASIAALSDQEYIKKIVRINYNERETLYEKFDELKLKYIRSYTNFITIESKLSNDIYNYLLNNGIIIRQIDNYGLPHHLRISIGTTAENQTLCASLAKFFA